MAKITERMLAGRYRLEQVIGRGGMSTVYRATDQVLGRTVAVKVLLAALADQDSSYAERFAREARAAAAPASSSVVTVYDTGVDEQGEQYIVMEYVAGRSLAELLGDEQPLQVAEAVAIGERVADALRVAHAAGVLHRDIKPANVMVADDGTVKVLDFGIARRLDGTTLTQAASVVGTAAYMSPERAVGRPGDARSDVYSLGCLLYAMLTGRPPFTGAAPAALLHQQVNAAPSPPSVIRPGISPALDALVLEMLAKNPEARPQAAEQVRDRLRAIAGLPHPPAAGATAATARLAAIPRTAALEGSKTPAIGRDWLSDHRRRAVVMGVLTALVTLVAVALLSGGGPPRAASHGAAERPPARTRHAPPRMTTARTTTPRATPPVTPAPPKPAGPTGGPPGHGGKPHGHGKGHGGPGGH